MEATAITGQVTSGQGVEGSVAPGGELTQEVRIPTHIPEHIRSLVQLTGDLDASYALFLKLARTDFKVLTQVAQFLSPADIAETLLVKFNSIGFKSGLIGNLDTLVKQILNTNSEDGLEAKLLFSDIRALKYSYIFESDLQDLEKCGILTLTSTEEHNNPIIQFTKRGIEILKEISRICSTPEDQRSSLPHEISSRFEQLLSHTTSIRRHFNPTPSKFIFRFNHT